MIDVIFRHLSGARATEVDTVPLGAHQELILGRAASAAVRFDARRDSGVGRHHARLVPLAENPALFMLVDLGSRNGTYVNGRRIDRQILLHAGDVLQLGADGPEVEFQVAVRPRATEHRKP